MKTCQHCGVNFEPNAYNNVFCSKKCQMKAQRQRFYTQQRDPVEAIVFDSFMSLCRPQQKKKKRTCLKCGRKHICYDYNRTCSHCNRNRSKEKVG